MGTIILKNNSFISEGSISLLDPHIFTGDGVFSTLMVKEGKVEFFSLHKMRLENHCKELNILCPLIDPQSIAELIEKNNAKNGTWKLKLIVFPKVEYLKNLTSLRQGDLYAILFPLEEMKKLFLTLCTYPEDVIYPFSKIKTVAYLHRHFLKGYAYKKGFDDVLVLYKEVILESSFANVFWIENKTLFFPNHSLPYLFGITLSKIIEAAKNIGFSIKEKEAKLADLTNSTLIFLSNSLIGFCPVKRIDDREFSIDSILQKKLQESFDEIKTYI